MDASRVIFLIRTFIAIPIPQPVHEAIDALSASLKKQMVEVRWVSQNNRHLTMAFLGDIPDRCIDDVLECAVITAKAFSPMRLFLKGVGVFPSIRQSRVLWVGIRSEDPQLGIFHNRLQTGLEKVGGIGYVCENRPFKPHLTIGRFTKPMDSKRLWSALESQTNFETPNFTVSEAHVFKSTLKSTGAVYDTLGVAPFGAAP